MKLEFGSDIIKNYRRLAYKPWFALAEFIDNSTQSYFNHKVALDEAYAANSECLEVRITYDRASDILRISDNAFGMDLKELEDALVIGKVPENATGRSQFGFGMKTAACWFGNEWTIITKKLGSQIEHEVVINVEKVATGKTELEHVSRVKHEAQHYTVVEIRQLHTKLASRTVGKTKEFLSSMYRVDFRSKTLRLFWEDQELRWEDYIEFLTRHDGTEYKRDFSFSVGEKSVYGWTGILGPGSAGRPRAGLTILRRGRVIQGFPNSWRPESIFGQTLGSNNLVNQRICGEIFLDQFEVSQTKDEILWQDNEEDELETRLKSIASDFIEIANITWKSRHDTRGPSETEVKAAVAELQMEMQSQEFLDLIQLETVPPEEVLAASNRFLVEAAEKTAPTFVATVGDEFSCRVFLVVNASPNDMYYRGEGSNDNTGKGLSIVVNASHPHWSQLGNTESVLIYLRHCVYDAIAEWLSQKKSQGGGLKPNTVMAFKDKLLRLPSKIEQSNEFESGSA